MNIDSVKQYKDEMVNDLKQLVSYKSVYSEDEKPFGSEVKKCLHKALEIASSYGFNTVNVDDYCGYIEMGQGDEIIGVLAHLDVVPVSDSWNSDPFQLTIIGDKLFGRGTSDDKGAVVCSLTALRMLKPLENTFKKRIRLILGCNEETGSAGIAYYVKKFGHVDCGFTPDGTFPLTFGEKGMVSGMFTGKSEKIVDIDGGIVSNAVAAKCTFKLIDSNVDKNKIHNFLIKNNIKYELNENILTIFGQAAHASTPELGINAISFGMEALYQSGYRDELIDTYHDLINTKYNGEPIGVGFKDEYGELTFNIGVAKKKDDNLVFTIDIRVPVTMDPEKIADILQNNSKGYVVVKHIAKPLFFPLDHPMIKALMKAYQDVTNDYDSQPFTMGGGTYAKSMNNIVAFGCEDNEFDYHIHDDNEFTTFNSLYKQTACYYQALLNLLEL